MEKTKLAHLLDTPYSATAWPMISQDDQDAILELLCRLLQPIGQYRRDHVVPSKGKRNRTAAKTKQEDAVITDESFSPPEIGKFVDVGLREITRALEDGATNMTKQRGEAEEVTSASLGYSTIFLSRAGPPSVFFSHFPQMVAVASHGRSHEKAIRLVGFSRACEDRLSECLGIPRVTSVAIRAEAPQAEGLVKFVRATVAPIEMTWLQQIVDGKHRPIKVEAMTTKIGEKKDKKPT